jgi:hypothetical protein
MADLHTLQFTATQALGFSVFTSRILATDLQQSHCNFKSHMKSSLHSLIHFFSVAFDCHLQNSTQFSTTRTTFFISLQPLGTDRAENLCIVEKACLLTGCLAMNVLLLLAYASAGMCLPSRCLAISLYVTKRDPVPIACRKENLVTP